MVMRWNGDTLKLNAIYINRRYHAYGLLLHMPGLTGMPESCQQLRHKKVFTGKLLVMLCRNQKWISNNYFSDLDHTPKRTTSQVFAPLWNACGYSSFVKSLYLLNNWTCANWQKFHGTCICEASKAIVVEPRWCKACCGNHASTVTLPMRNALHFGGAATTMRLQIRPILSFILHCCPCSRISHLIQAQEKCHSFHYKLRAEHSTAAPRYP